MSLITSCPTCGTMFRVVPDQLKISEGWVRCGHCSEVFDATSHLSDESVLGALPEAQATRSAAQDDYPPTPLMPTPEPAAPAPATRPEALIASAELLNRPTEPSERMPAAAPQTSNRSEDPSSFFG